MSYPVDLGEDSGRQISSLHALCSGYPGGQVIIGWCVGNRQQSNPGLLLGALAEHDRVLEECWTDDKVRLTVHTAEYQSQWNTGIVGKHFTGLRRDAGSDRDVLGEKQLFDETRRRCLDGKRYEAQVRLYLHRKSGPMAPAAASPQGLQSTAKPAGEQVALPPAKPAFDALVTEGGGPVLSGGVSVEKERHVATASREMKEIIDKPRYGGEDECVAFRQALIDRQLVLMRYTRQKLLKKQVGNERSLLQQNEKMLVDLAKRAFAGDGPAKQRRAELLLHSMDVLVVEPPRNEWSARPQASRCAASARGRIRHTSRADNGALSRGARGGIPRMRIDGRLWARPSGGRRNAPRGVAAA